MTEAYGSYTRAGFNGLIVLANDPSLVLEETGLLDSVVFQCTLSPDLLDH